MMLSLSSINASRPFGKTAIRRIMKIFLPIALFSCAEQAVGQKEDSCNSVFRGPLTGQELPEGVEILMDTFDVSVHGSLRKVVFFNGGYYCMFETCKRNTTVSFKKMVVIGGKGDFVEHVFLPESIQDMTYYDMFVENDSLFLKRTQFDEETFLLDKDVASFSRIESRDFAIYKDSLYRIFGTCYGEWGGTIFFEDIGARDVFEVSSTCPVIVTKMNQEYYITNYMSHGMGVASVIRIPDPTKLHKSKLEFGTDEGSQYTDGTEVLLDTIGFYIPTSFAVNGNLWHLYSDEEGTYIGRITKGKITPVYRFGFTFYTHVNQQDGRGRQILAFNVPNSEDKGILVIDNGKINFHFID